MSRFEQNQEVRVYPARQAWTLALLLVCTLAGCNCSPVARDLSQHEATKVVALLGRAGIGAQADMERGARGRYRVDAECSEYAAAVGLLAAFDLPSKPRPSAEVFAQQSLLPGSRQFELLRVDHALALELEDLLRGVPQVEDVRAVVRTQSVEDPGQASVAVTINVRKGSSIDAAAVLPVVQRSVPGVSPEHVSISIHESQAADREVSVAGVARGAAGPVSVPLVPFFAWRVADDDYSGLALTFIGAIMVVGTATLALGYYFGSLPKRDRGGDEIGGRSRKELPEG